MMNVARRQQNGSAHTCIRATTENIRKKLNIQTTIKRKTNEVSVGKKWKQIFRRIRRRHFCLTIVFLPFAILTLIYWIVLHSHDSLRSFSCHFSAAKLFFQHTCMHTAYPKWMDTKCYPTTFQPNRISRSYFIFCSFYIAAEKSKTFALCACAQRNVERMRDTTTTKQQNQNTHTYIFHADYLK